MPHVELPQAEFKVCMLGDTNAGKTSLVLRFAEGYYRDSGRAATVGAFFITKRIQTSNGITCKVQIWDTAGQPQFRPMAPMYYKNAAATIVCYDITCRRSFQVMREWVKELHEAATAGNIVIAIAATKSDLLDENAEPELKNSKEQVAALAASIGAIFIDTSAKSNMNVNQLFLHVAERVLYLRERAKQNGITGEKAIPVIPGASVDEYGTVVKQGNGMNHDERFTPTRRRNINEVHEAKILDDKNAGGMLVQNADPDVIETENGISRGICGSPFLECGAIESGQSSNSSCNIL